jgi:hypothetical protein
MKRLAKMGCMGGPGVKLLPEMIEERDDWHVSLSSPAALNYQGGWEGGWGVINISK